MKRYLALALSLAFPLGSLYAQEKTPPSPASPPTILLRERQSKVVPTRSGFNHTGGGNIDVIQPAPDTIVLTMTGVAVAGAHPFKNSMAAQDFDLSQCFEVALEKPEGKKLKLITYTRVIGLLRSNKCGGGVAEESGSVSLSSGHVALTSIPVPSHTASGGENLSVNDQNGPVSTPVATGLFTVHQVFHVGVTHPCSVLPIKASSAEFAPDPAMEPLWISYWEPFHGAIKKDFGFQVVIKVVAE